MIQRLSYLWPFLRPHRRKILFGLVTILASVLIGLAGPLLVGRAVDAVRQHASYRLLVGFAALLVGLSVCQGVFSYLQRMILVGMSRDIEFELRNVFFDALERQPAGYFQDHPTGDLMARATNDLQAVRMVCGPALMYATTTLITGAGCLFFMLRINVLLTLIALVAMPLVVVSTIVFGRRIHGLFSSVQGKFADITAKTQESLAGVRVVRAYAQEAREEAEFARVNQEYLEGNRRLAAWSTAMHPMLQMLIGIGFAAVMWYGGLLVVGGRISVGEFVSFNLFLTKLIWPVIALGWVVNLTQRGTASLARIRTVLDMEPAIRDEEPLVEPVNDRGAIQGDISFRGLTFSYKEGTEPVLEGIDLQVAAGQTVAVVGRTGSGKSTLLNLIPRLIDPPAGMLWVDGTDVRRLPLARLRSAIGMVPQETFLFSATLRENIALGRPEATLEEVAEAARLAGLGSDLGTFPKGLDTVVGERGLTLSGGQKQRVALARALLRQSSILLLDDCLSAVDTHTEEEILKNLRTVFRGRTVFLVSHRVSTVKDADVILVLERGRIVERGTHSQLTVSGGLYAELHQRQLLEEELAAV
ncbi:MAG TPA: ABC transporter ATP-binding protein [Thermoanaerobaculia bacterium]|nr:ABC transporter ATP-binding protein [Thermoanaerobaculia bacterium]